MIAEEPIGAEGTTTISSRKMELCECGCSLAYPVMDLMDKDCSDKSCFCASVVTSVLRNKLYVDKIEMVRVEHHLTRLHGWYQRVSG